YDAGPDAARDAARTIQRWICDRLGLSATVGIGPNKLVAKMASGVRKPRGLTLLDAAGFRRRFWEQPSVAVWGIGEQTAAAPVRLGVTTVGDLAHCPEERLSAAFGVNGPRMKVAAWGEDLSPVVPYYEGVDARSMGHEFTLVRDESDPRVLDGLLV